MKFYFIKILIEKEKCVYCSFQYDNVYIIYIVFENIKNEFITVAICEI